MLLDDVVVGDGRCAACRTLGVTALVDELTDSLEVGVAVGNEGLDDLQHLACGLGQADEDAIVDLEETEELEGLALLGVDLVDTLDTDWRRRAWSRLGRRERCLALRHAWPRSHRAVPWRTPGCTFRRA